jgi:hypothetical protein
MNSGTFFPAVFNLLQEESFLRKMLCTGMLTDLSDDMSAFSHRLVGELLSGDDGVDMP